MQQAEIKSFLINYSNGNYSEEDHKRFIQWLKTASVREIEKVIEEYKIIIEYKPLSEHPPLQVIAQIEAAINQREADALSQKSKKRKKIVLWRIGAAAAAVAILIVGLFIYRLLNKNSSGNISEKIVAASVRDVQAPRRTKATITLSNGQVISLDSINNGVLSRQGNVNIVKTAKAGIAYKSASEQVKSAQVKYNTLYNPRGSMVVHLTLADGTRVWLNSESSLHYPVSFRGNKREVKITGEAYFEVAKNANKKFIVDANGVITEVLGTHFNVNAYKEEGRTVVTLLEGAVRVEKFGASVLIEPGQQVIATNTVRVVSNVDMGAVMAWKNGEFIMKSVAVGDIMRQIARWYDVKVIYKGGIPDGTISGEVSRNLNLSQILKVFEYSGVHVKLDSGKVIVIP